ncbi:hypothetical protein KFE98_01430 [bacterium SCSIO 12741]|nr:hypothetical protein KFE98_01430 [bacterium SCSIO 12741]
MKSSSFLPVAIRLLAFTSLFALGAFIPSTPDPSEFTFINTLMEKLDLKSQEFPEDKVYLHFDKTMYQPGEDIWFSVYLLNGSDFSASDRSDVLHVELIAPNGKAVVKKRVETKDGRALGDFKLENDAPGGAYKVKTYTNLQNQEGTPFLFEKELHVQDVNPPELKMKLDFDRKGYSPGEEVELKLELKSSHKGPLMGQEYKVDVKLNQEIVFQKRGVTGQTGKAQIKFTLPENVPVTDGLVNAEILYNGLNESISRAIPYHKDDLSLRLFPEGGDLINGFTSRVAFKASNSKGKPMDISGRVVNSVTQEVLDTFKSFHHGMGHFNLMPEYGQSYHVEITNPDFIQQRFPLPGVSNKNMALQVSSVSENNIRLKIRSNSATGGYLVLTVRDQLYYGDTLDLDQGANLVTIPTHNVPMGVARITLFNRHELPVAERLVFASRDKQLDIDIQTDKEVYLPREKVTASIQVKDDQGNPVAASLSMAVVDDQLLSFSDDRSAHILSNLLLEYELREKVEEPQAYFRTDKESLQKMDYLMMTAGWRRFEWSEIQHLNRFGGVWSGEIHDPILRAQLDTVQMDLEIKRNQLFEAQQANHKNVLCGNNAQVNYQVFQDFNGNAINWNNQVGLANQVNKAVVASEVPQVQLDVLASGASNVHFVAANFVGMDELEVKEFAVEEMIEFEDDIVEEKALLGVADQMDEERKEVNFLDLKNRKGRFKQEIQRPVHGNARLPQHIQETLMQARQFQAPSYENLDLTNSSAFQRNDFRSTIYWNGLVEVDESGKAEISFYNNDDVSSFRITTEGIGQNGTVGRKTKLYSTQIPLSVKARLPLEVLVGDTLKIPVVLANNTEGELFGQLKVDIPSGLKWVKKPSAKKVLDPGVQVTWAHLVCEEPVAKGQLAIQFSSADYQDGIEQQLTVKPRGIPVNQSFSGQEMIAAHQLDLKAVEKGSVQASVTLYPSLMADIMTGVESILREPNGCFEQTSATSYPNIMVMKYMQESGIDNEKVTARANGLIDRGYKRLVGFETSSKGYEWFGKAPGHEGLTAYGLMQFHDMMEVYQGVDQRMMERTQNWLLAKKDGQGGFHRNSYALHNYGQISNEVLNGYIVYALSESGENRIAFEAQTANNQALQSNDPYLLAMSASCLFNLNQNQKAQNTLDQLMGQQKPDGQFMGKTHSITYSTGKSLEVETTALAVLAMLKSDHYDAQKLSKAVKFLTNSRSGTGGFGSTQATILALKALTAYSKQARMMPSSGTVSVFVDGVKRGSVHYDKGSQEAIVLDGFARHLKPQSVVQVKFSETNSALPYTLSVDYTTSQTPISAQTCKVKVTSSWSEDQVKLGETARLTTVLENTTSEGIPSTMCIIGIPGGFSLQPWQLKELMKAETFDYYEIRGNQLLCYYRGMTPGEKRTIRLDLKTEVPGTYESSPSSAYLYYTNEFKSWSSTKSVEILE